MTASWYALYTKSRHEKSIGVELSKRRIDSFLPTRRIKRRWSDRTVTIEEPLFKSYLFVHTDPSSPAEVLGIPGVVKFVGFGGAPLVVDAKVIECLKTVVRQEIAADPFPYLAAGDRVIVRSGVFKGVEGFLVRKDARRCRVVISIAAMMASVSIEVDSSLVDKV